MVSEQRERELKFEVGSDFVLPAAAHLLKGSDRSVVIEPSTVDLESTYWDTAERALLAHRVTLRRRTGDTDTGWHLKIPDADARMELRLPLGRAGAPPAELRELVAGLTLGAALHPVATIRTKRRRLQVVDGSRLLAEIADDTVQGVALEAPGPTTTGNQTTEWREVEIELAGGSEKLLQRLARTVRAAGARPSSSGSKLARTLGAEAQLDAVRDDAHCMVGDYLTRLSGALSAGDIALRRGLDPIHKTRVAVRSLRSAIRTFGPVLEADAQDLEPDLSWYQNMLGEVRDRQVQRIRLAAAAATLGPPLSEQSVAEDIDAALAAEQHDAEQALRAAIDGARYRSMMRAVRAFAADPPLLAGSTVDDLVARTTKARRSASKRLKRGVRDQDAAMLHRARKAAKRARYAGELTEAVTGKSGSKHVDRLKTLQDALGEFQDSVTSMEILLRLAERTPAAPGPVVLAYGVLYEREHVAQAAMTAAAKRLPV